MWSCEICNKTYTLKQNLVRHIQSGHGNMDTEAENTTVAPSIEREETSESKSTDNDSEDSENSDTSGTDSENEESEDETDVDEAIKLMQIRKDILQTLLKFVK